MLPALQYSAGGVGGKYERLRAPYLPFTDSLCSRTQTGGLAAARDAVAQRLQPESNHPHLSCVPEQAGISCP